MWKEKKWNFNFPKEKVWNLVASIDEWTTWRINVKSAKLTGEFQVSSRSDWNSESDV